MGLFLVFLNELIDKCFKFFVLISNMVNIEWHNLHKLNPFEVLGNF